MARTLNEVMKSLPKARRAKVKARATELIAEEASLQNLRKAFGLTQVTMAKKLKGGQDTVSRIEKRTDILLSTLFGYAKAMGGELKLVAEFPDRPPVRLQMLEPLKKRAAPARRKAAKAKRA